MTQEDFWKAQCYVQLIAAPSPCRYCGRLIAPVYRSPGPQPDDTFVVFDCLRECVCPKSQKPGSHP